MAHLDRAHGNDADACWKGSSNGAKLAEYAITYSLIQTHATAPDYNDLVAYCNSIGANPENAFQHYYNNTDWSHQANSGAPKTGSVTGCGADCGPGGNQTTRANARVPGWRFNIDRWEVNWADTTCWIPFLKNLARTHIAANQGGWFIDEYGHLVSPTATSITSCPTASVGGLVYEFRDGGANPNGRTCAAYMSAGGVRNDNATMLAAVLADAQSVLSTFFMLPNGGFDIGATVADAAKGTYAETVTAEYPQARAVGEKTLWDFSASLGASTKFAVMEGSLNPPAAPNYQACNYPTTAARNKMFHLADYWMMQQGRNTWFIQLTNNNPASTYWKAAQERDIGTPSGAYSLWKQSPADGAVDAAGQQWKIYRRTFSSGAIILFRPFISYTDSSDFGVKTPLFSLGGTYKVLYSDNTLGPDITEIGLCLNEGAVLIPQ